MLTAEIYTRFESQRLSFTLTVTLLGAVVAALTKGDLSGEGRTAVLLAVPVFIAPAAAIFFDNEIMIYRLANRIVNVLQPEVAVLVGQPRALAGHEYGLGGVRRFTQHGLCLRADLFVTVLSSRRSCLRRSRRATRSTGRWSGLPSSWVACSTFGCCGRWALRRRFNSSLHPRARAAADVASTTIHGEARRRGGEHSRELDLTLGAYPSTSHRPTIVPRSWTSPSLHSRYRRLSSRRARSPG